MEYYHIIAFILFFILIKYKFKTSRALNEVSDIYRDGYIVKHDIIDVSYIANKWDNKQYEDIYKSLRKNSHILKFIKNNIGDDFILMDYIMFLSNSVLHTCHRDNNGSRFNKLKYKSYTVLIYIEDMDKCLDVIPKSHKHIGFYFTDPTKTFMCKKGSIIIFDSDLVHAGSVDHNPDNRRIQMKICHKDDINTLSFYDKYYKIIDKENANSHESKRFQKDLTCTYPLISDLTQGNDKGYISGDISFLAKIFSSIFYSDKNYYKLKDAF